MDVRSEVFTAMRIQVVFFFCPHLHPEVGLGRSSETREAHHITTWRHNPDDRDLRVLTLKKRGVTVCNVLKWLEL